MAILGILIALMFPALVAGREKGRQAYCANNLRQLHLANTMYADDHDHYVAAASDIFTSNLRRWHGIRESTDEPFDSRNGPLAPYLGLARRVRRCPSFLAYVGNQPSANTFESSCGGYGYNDRGVGSKAYLYGYTEEAAAEGMSPSGIRNPSQTVMFSDTAFPQPYDDPTYLIEYSFAEAYHFVSGNPPAESSSVAKPSVHFRHGERVNVLWCDGHISSEELTTEAAESYFADFEIGWFGGADNSLFDPY